MNDGGVQPLDSQPASMSRTVLRLLSSRTTTGSSCDDAPPYTRPGERVAVQRSAPLWHEPVWDCVCLSTIDTSSFSEPEARLSFSLPDSLVVARPTESPKSKLPSATPEKRRLLLRVTTRSRAPAAKPGVGLRAVTRR